MEGPDHWQRVEELFHSALKREPDQRAAFLSKACASDLQILAEVQALIQAHEDSGSFLHSPKFGNLAASSIDNATGSMIGLSLNRFKVLSLLGRGGMGEVYLAEDTKLGRKVAIKSLPARLMEDDNAKKRLMREARAAARLNHPNICAIYEVGEEANHSFIVMQYIEGDTLSSKIQRKEVRLTESVDIAIQIAAALSSAHSSGIIHRDIKPQNVIIGPDGQVKVLDFGLVKTIATDEAGEVERESLGLVTEAGALVGTAAYMSPEQVKNSPLSASSDLFSLGALLYECVTSRPAFSGNSLMEICAQVIHVSPSPPSLSNPLVPPELDRIILKALAKDTGARYQSALEILTDLRRVRDSIEPKGQVRRRPIEILPIAARIKSKMSLRAFARSKHLKTGLIVIAIAALALWVGFHLRHGSPHQTTPDVQRFYEMGRSALSDGSYYQGSKMLERALSLDNEFPLAHARLAEAWVEMDYPDRAKDELLLATTLIPDRGALAQSDRLYLDAIAATVRRDFAAAVGNFREIAEQSSDAQKALAYVELGRAYQRNEEPQKAIESYLEAIKYDSQYAGAYLQLGILYRRQQDLPKAEESFDKAEAIYDALGNHEGVTEVLFQRGYLFNIVDRLADAQEQLKKALEKAQITANKHQLIRILLQLSSLSCTQGEAAQARLYADQAVDLAQADNTESLAANGIIDLGNSFFVKGEFAEAEKYFKQAIEFAQRSKSRRTEARGLLSLGSLLIQKNDADGGLRYTEQALAFYRQGGYSKETSQALILLARGNRQKGNYDVALQAFEQQLRLAEEIGDQAQIAYSHSSIGILLGFYQERYSEALSHFQASYEINHSLGVKVNSGYDLMNKGGLLFQVGRYQDARAALNQASAIANNTDTSYKQLLASIYLLKSRLELSEGRLAEAMKNSQQAADLAGASFKDIAIESRYTRGMALALSGKAREGKLACEEAVNMATSLGNPRLLSNGLLALAEVTLIIGDWPGASTTALQAQARFAQQGAKDSEWRAWLIAARAAAGAGDRLVANTYATQAAGALSDLQPKLGDEYYKSYLDRADIKGYRNQLDEILAANK